MSAPGWLLSVSMPVLAGAPPIAWSLVGLLFVALMVTAGIGVQLYRTDPSHSSPIDSETLVGGFEQPLAVLDSEDSVLVTNDSFNSMFGTSLTGEPIEDVIDHPELQSLVTDRTEGVVAITKDGDTRQYQVQVSSVGEPQRSPHQWIVLLGDVTDYYDEQAQLEAENERLEQFAELVSHDLRNPLDVAIGRTNAVKEILDDPELEMHLSRIQGSHTRMKQIISDLLTLARAGNDIGETQQVPLETVAMDAWTHVETGEAALSVNTQLVIDADRECVIRVFENLFRNARQHAGETVHVEVGSLEDRTGFFISDTGDGIDPSEQEAILDAGYTSSENGTGLGLAIVSGIAEAHGWEMSVGDGNDGGARFEFANVQRVTDETTTPHVE
jgi:signal transduction histidine kinase